MKNRIGAGILALLLTLFCAFPAFAEDAPPDAQPPISESGQGVGPVPPAKTVPGFSAEMVYSYEGWSIYGTLGAITADMAQIIPCYSFDGENYVAEGDNCWNIVQDELRQKAFFPNEKPISEFLAERTDFFSVRLEITYTDGGTAVTQAVEFKRSAPRLLPDEYNVDAWYEGSVRINGSPFSGRYHFTVSPTATADELAALLPKTVPVELQLGRTDDRTRHTAVVYYTVTWPAELPTGDGGDIQIWADKVEPPKSCTVNLGTEVYILAPPEIAGRFAPLQADLHLATDDDRTVQLTENDTEQGGILATFLHKPTGATAIVVEYSTDGKNWTELGDVLPSAPLEQAQPKMVSHTVCAMLGDAQPLTDYTNGDISGFYVRLRVEGGALSGYTEAAAWPTDYEYVPPRDDSSDDGSGGNSGNIGSGNNSGDSSTSGGQRPDLPPDGDTTQEPPSQPSPEPIPEPTPEPIPEPTPEPSPEPSPEPMPDPTPELPVIAPVEVPPEHEPSAPPTTTASSPVTTPTQPSIQPPNALPEEIPPERMPSSPATAVVVVMLSVGGAALCAAAFPKRLSNLFKRFFSK